jgi:hypothetical protein
LGSPAGSPGCVRCSSTRLRVERQIGHYALVQERQRTVIVVATGLALVVLAITINRHLSDMDAGWFAYAPNTGVTFEPSSSNEIWREAAIWLGAIAAWSGISLWLYRRPPRT